MKYEVQGDVIVNSRGDVMAHLVYGEWETKNDEVLAFIADLSVEAEKPKVVKAKPVKVEVVKEVKKAKSIFSKPVED